ncbi:MAG: hypothetical protein RR142_05095 [Clostridia bacterium]
MQRKHLTAFSVLFLMLALLCHTPAQALAPTTQPVQLVYQAGYMPFHLKESFAKEHPNIEIIHQLNENNAEAVAQSITTQDSSVDIFMLKADYVYMSMLRKGMMADLSTSQYILDDVTAMYQPIREILMDEKGCIAAYPAELYIMFCKMNTAYWQMIFKDQPLPTTIGDLLDAWIQWETDAADDYPELTFIGDFDYAQWCERLVTLYARQHDQQGLLPDMGHPALRSAFEKLRQVYEIRKANGRSVSEPSAEELEQVTPLVQFTQREAMNEPSSLAVTLSEDFLYGVKKGAREILPLTFASGDEQKLDGTLYVYIINPYSKHIPEAIAFIECAMRVENNPYTYYSVHPDVNEPYQWPDYAQSVTRYTAEKEQLEQTLKKTNDESTADLTYQLAYVNDWLAAKEEQRWMISQKTIEQYRSTADRMRLDLHSESVYLGDSGASSQLLLQSLCERYASGTMTLDGFLTQLDEKMRRMYLEGV